MARLKLSAKRRKGAILVLVYMVIVSLAIYAVAFLNRGVYHYRAVTFSKEYTQAFDLAEAGLDRAISWLRVQPSYPNGNYTNPWPGGVQNLGTGNNIIGDYTVSIFDLGAPSGGSGMKRYKVTSTGVAGAIKRTLTNYLQTDNYARFIWFTDQENYGTSEVWFWTQDYLDGPTHTNTHFNVFGQPTFDGEAESADEFLKFYNNGHEKTGNDGQINNTPYDKPNFNAGMTFGVNQTAMPSKAANLRAAAATDSGMWFQGDTTIVLNSNSTMTVTNSKKGWTNHNGPLPANGALFVTTDSKGNGGNLNISGALNGRLTVGAARDVNIPGNLTYVHDPRVNATSTDTMGIISEQDVVIDSNAPTNLEIDASIMALKSSFMLDNWDSGSPKGNLTVYGGIIQDQRGPVGTFNGATGQKLTGYSKNYSYDERLLTSPPPFVPTTGDFITLSWEED
jgi:hypothetical protein